MSQDTTSTAKRHKYTNDALAVRSAVPHSHSI